MVIATSKNIKRYGVKGYAGGNSWCHKNITFNPNIHVAQAGLNFLTLFNEECHIEARPKIYLTREEIDFGRRNWQSLRNSSIKIVIAPGGGFEENAGEMITSVSCPQAF